MELHIDGLTWREEFCMANPVSVGKANQHWLHIAFHSLHFLQPGWRWTLLLGRLLFCCSIVPISPTFITSYNLGKQGWVYTDLLLMFHADFCPMLLRGTNFTAICPMLKSSNKIRWHVLYDSPIMLHTWWILFLSMVLVDNLMHLCNIFRHSVDLKLFKCLSSSTDVH